MYNGIACINGIITSIEKAQIPISDRGFLFGHSIFETLLVKNGVLQGWNEHYERMKKGCQQAYISVPTEEILKNWVLSTIGENIVQSKMTSQKTQLKIIVTAGSGFDLPISKTNGELQNPNVVIMCRNLPDAKNDKYSLGVALKSIADLRSAGLINIKSCSYLYNIIAIESAKKEGFDDAIFYNSENNLTECTTANFIWFDKNKTVYSTPFLDQCLAGTTLLRLKENLHKRKIQFVWQELKRTELQTLSGCAMISSVRGIMPINRIDNQLFNIAEHKDFYTELNELL